MTDIGVARAATVKWEAMLLEKWDSSTERMISESTETATNRIQPRNGRAPVPRYQNVASRCIFPAVYVLSLANNFVSFVVIIRSNIRQTSTGVYLAVLAWADSLAITSWPLIGGIQSSTGVSSCRYATLTGF